MASLHATHVILAGEIEETRLTMSDFPGKGKVAVLKTSPETVLDDIEKLMKLADFDSRPAQRAAHRHEDQHLLADLVPGLLLRALAARRRDPRAAERRLQRPGRRAQRHRGGRYRRRRAQQQAPLRHRQVRACPACTCTTRISSGWNTSPSSPSWCWTRSIPRASSSPRRWSA